MGKLPGWALVIGVLFLLGFDVAGRFDLPPIIKDLISSILLLLEFLGIKHLLDDAKRGFLESVFDWKSKTLLGGLIAFIAPIFVYDLIPGMPNHIFIDLLGYIALALGLVDAGIRGGKLKPLDLLS